MSKALITTSQKSDSPTTNESTPPKLTEYLRPNREPLPNNGDLGCALDDSKAVWLSFLEGNSQMASRVFTNFDASKVVAKQQMKRLFAHEGEARSLQLRKHAEAGLIPESPSVAERVRKLCP